MSAQKPVDVEALIEPKYRQVLIPFIAQMNAELLANETKGDRPGWLSMSPAVCMLEIYYHAAKLQKAVKDDEGDRIREYAADVANMAMMMLDICGGLRPVSAPAEQRPGRGAIALRAELDQLDERRARDAAVERLIAADVEFDAAFRDWEHATAADPEELSKEAWERIAGRFEEATMERIAALDAVRGGDSHG